MLEKAASIKRFEYLPLGIELKKQTDIAKKAIPKTRKGFSAWQKIGTNTQKRRTNNKKEAIVKKGIKKYHKSNLIYNSKFTFHK